MSKNFDTGDLMRDLNCISEASIEIDLKCNKPRHVS
jgi:hypothetical protein